MKIITFKQQNTPSNGEKAYRIGALISEREILDLSGLVSERNLTAAELLDCFDLEKGFLDQARLAVDRPQTAQLLNLDRVTLCAPVPRPSKIICIGLNYRDHAAESRMPIPCSPVIFSKFSSSVIGPHEPIAIPQTSQKVDYEAELAFVVGRRAKNVARRSAMHYLLGYTNFNDVSARDFQFADGQWQRGKSCDTFAPMGPFIATTDELPDPHNLSIRLRLNGRTRQDSKTSELIFKIPELVEFLSKIITLEVGDVVATGTPAGVGFARTPPVFMKDGDLVEVEIEGLGVLSNPVRRS